MIDIDLIVAILKAAIPSLRIFPTYAAATTQPPYAVYVNESTPILSKDGIDGWEGTFDISVLDRTKAKVEALTESVITALDGTDTTDGTSISLESTTYSYYFEDSTHSYSIKFKLLK